MFTIKAILQFKQKIFMASFQFPQFHGRMTTNGGEHAQGTPCFYEIGERLSWQIIYLFNFLLKVFVSMPFFFRSQKIDLDPSLSLTLLAAMTIFEKG